MHSPMQTARIWQGIMAPICHAIAGKSSRRGSRELWGDARVEPLDTGVKQASNAGESAVQAPGGREDAVRSKVMFAAVSALAMTCALAAGAAQAADGSGLLFRASGDHGLKAEVAGGDALPNFQDKVVSRPDGRMGGYMQAADNGVVAWNAPGNIYAQRGTLSFFWRSRYPVGRNPFNIFRVGYADHTSWDMTWLRIDWNGHGFDAFVTDDNLARVRVSYTIPQAPKADGWSHVAVAWDETYGLKLYVDGKLAQKVEQKAVLDSGLDQFGMAWRVLSPHQVQSRYNYLRGSDFDELRVYDHMLDDGQVAALARGEDPAAPAQPVRTLADAATRAEWLHRYGWDKGAAGAVALTAPSTAIRKVEFADAKDLKEWMYKGTDGIAETTWPGVYNRSRLPGRHDYFELPDWNVYVEGGKRYDLTLPDEPFNRVELQGAAFGALTYQAPAAKTEATLEQRPQGEERSAYQFGAERRGGRLSFTNTAQETPIQEIAAYDVKPGTEPEGSRRLSYTVKVSAAADLPELQGLKDFIAGRYEPGSRTTVVALPAGAPARERKDRLDGPGLPIAHVLIPSNFNDSAPGLPVLRTYAYGWEDMHDGLDGLGVDLPALHATPGSDGLIPLNIQVKDPLWPARDLMDVTVAVKPGEARTLWLDTRDRILPNAPLYLTIASAAGDFDARQLDGMHVRLIFKDREAAKVEHVADRFAQVKDNWGFLVEEHTTSKRQRLYARLFADITDLLKVDPEHEQGRMYWADITAGSQGWPAFKQPAAPAGEPLWAFRQLEDLRLVKQFTDWWIDERQVAYGDFGGGISDDTDLVEQWPGLALMGVEPDKVTRSHDALVAANHRNDMWSNGLSRIRSDELHSYEEGINSNSESAYLHWGDPAAMERLMETAAAYPRLTERNPAGHVHITTDYFSGTDVVREDPWQWSKSYSYLIFHPGLLMVDWNAQPATRKLLIDVADGYLAHGKVGADGITHYPEEINWPDDHERGGEGPGEAVSLLYSAYRWTGDAKYLQPILNDYRRRGFPALAWMNANLLDLLSKRGEWTPAILKAAGSLGPGDGGSSSGGRVRGDSFTKYLAWEATGDKRYLERLFGDEIQSASQRMYMVTEGHWWSDRVETPSDSLQRTRMGGIALKRNQEAPGNTVSWRFDRPDDALKTAILMPGATPTKFKVVAYNTSDAPVAASLVGWDVKGGTWRVSTGEGAGDDDHFAGAPQTREVEFEPTVAVPLAFAPHRTTVATFELVRPSGDDPTQRPDVGIGAHDVYVRGSDVRVTVHGLGSKPSPAGEVRIEDASGKVVTRTALPPIAAPLDLTPKTATVHLRGPTVRDGARVRVVLNGDVREITQSNNVVPLG